MCELMDLVERGRGCDRLGGGGGAGSGRRCRASSSRARGIRVCCADDRDGKSETQTLFEVLFRITRVKTSGGRARARCGCGGGRPRDAGLSRLVRQLLDELERDGGGGCGCRSCHEYFEVNSVRVRKALGEIEGECGGGRQDGCGCQLVGLGGGCSGCDGVVTKVVCGRQPRRSRSGNVHVGWSLR